MLQIKNMLGGGKPEGLYVWKKLSAQGGDFIDYIVSDKENAYPDGGEKGGYWYEKVVEGAKVASGTITLSSSQNSLTIPHNLGKIPSKFAIMPISKTFDSSYTLCSMGIDDTIIRTYYSGSSPYSGYFESLNKSKVTMNETNIIVPCYFSDLDYKNYNWLSGTYHWIAIAE